MIAFEKIEEFGVLIDKGVELNSELEALMYRCMNDSSMIPEYSRKLVEYREFAQRIIDFKLK